MNDNGVSGGDADAQAAHWYARLQTLPVSAETLQQFFAWRQIDGNREAFDAVDRFYSQAGNLRDRPAIIAATEQAMSRPAGRSFRRPTPRGAMAAAGLGLAIAGIAMFVNWPLGRESYATGIGEQRKVVLADGSKLMLDTDTELTVKLADNARRVSLKRGQAYFTVAHDAARPFMVDAGSAGVLATGTEFDVRRNGDKIDVTLVEGRVRVSSNDRLVASLRAGQRLTLDGDHINPVQALDTEPATAWTRGRIVLDGVTLEHAIAEVNRYVDKPVRLEAPRFAGARLSGSVETGDVRSFATAVSAVLPLKSRTGSDGSISLRQ